MSKRKIISNKLRNLYGSNIMLPENTDSFVNLSKYTPTEDERQFLNLGLNCHIMTKFNLNDKKVEMEILYEDLLSLEREGKIAMNSNLKDLLRAEGTKHRCELSNKSNILTDRMKQAAKSLKSNTNIVIRKADKSNLYVLMDRQEYLEKLQKLISDESKFKPLSANPVDTLKIKCNKLIKKSNGYFREIIGDYSPGYLYGTVKTHKKDPRSLRPVISQITTPTYQISKKLDELIKGYIPDKYMLKSRDEFIEILRANNCKKLSYSLDVESLFTNVPVNETIRIILEYVYNNENLDPPNIDKQVLKDLLETCTTQVPFRNAEGKLYIQKDDVSMGSPWDQLSLISTWLILRIKS